MDPLESLLVGDVFRDRVRATADRLGPVTVVASPKWRAFADRLDLADGGANRTSTAALVVGPLAAVLRHIDSETSEFGFVMPVARIAKPWQRGSRWRDDATLALWHAGWTPINIDRLLVPDGRAMVEFVIGDARQTPVRADV